MRLMLAVILTALSILFLLSSLALGAYGRLRHPLRVVAALVALLVLGLVLLAD
ncbi:MAG TPA: hypothetical protein VFO03_12675 [Gaiellaceae bacterium]|nr:hypothetical protein [Gaiellaceae bacterium]